MSTLPTRFTRNALSNYLGTFVSIVLAIGVIPLLVRGLGKEAYGIWALTMSSALYLTLLNGGLGGAIVRFVAASYARNDREELRQVIATATFALMIPSAVIIVASPGLAVLFPVFFHIPHRLVLPAMVLVVLSVVEVGLAISSDTFGSTLAGLQRYDALNVTVAGTALAQAAAWAVIIALGGGLIALGVATLTFSLVGQLARYAMVRRLLGEKFLRRRYFARPLVRTMLATSGWMALDDLSKILIFDIDGLIVGLVAGIPQAAVYLVAQKLAGLGLSVTNPVAQLFYPHATSLAATDDRAGLRDMIYLGTRISLAPAIPILLVLSVLAGPILDIWVGSGFQGAAIVVVLLCGAQVVNTVPRASMYVSFGMGHIRVPALLSILDAVLNVVLSIVLGLAIGFKGVALATLIAGSVVNLGLLLPYACRRAGVSPASLLLAVIRTHLPAAAASLAVGELLRRAGFPAGSDAGGGVRLLEVLVAGGAMVVTYFAFLFLTGLSSTERSLVLVRLRLKRLQVAP